MKTRDASLVVLGLAVLLSGCDARKDVAQPPAPSEPRSMKEQLAELERSGVLP